MTVKTLTICLGLWAAFFARDTIAQISPKKVIVNGAELHYIDQGKGDAVIFVHGGLDDYRVWQPQMQAFSQRYRTVAYSRRYNYPNARVAPRIDYSAIVDAEDLAALIKKLRLGPAHIVGVSYGAYVALFLAARHPDLVRSLVLSEPPLLCWLPELEAGQLLFTEFMTKVWKPAARGFRKGDEAGIEATIDGFGELGYSGTDQKMTFATLPPEVRSSLLENSPEWRALTMSNDAFPFLSLDAVRRIKAPTLLLSGQRSLPLHSMLDSQLERLLPHEERIILTNATHEMWNEYPQECRSATFVFFAKQHPAAVRQSRVDLRSMCRSGSSTSSLATC
jgi:pimeloyl-ACP methyl ester carboxylesterase